MAIDRTAYNALVDDDGSNTIGTPWTKNIVKTVLLDPIDVDLALKATLVSPALTGTPTAPTAAAGTNTTQLATTAFVTGNQLRCSAFNTTTQSVATATVVALTFDSESFDVGAFHSTVTNTSRITIPAGGGGVYLLLGEVTITVVGTGTLRQIQLMLNGTAFDTAQYGVTAPGRLQILGTATVVAGDYLEVAFYQDTGSPMTTGSGAAAFQNRLTAIKVG